MEMTLLITDEVRNRFMRACDLCPSNKVFITDKLTVTFTPKLNSKYDYFMKIIMESKRRKDFQVAAICFEDEMFISPGIDFLSDGERVYFKRS